jgi:hypothetical protein
MSFVDRKSRDTFPLWLHAVSDRKRSSFFLNNSEDIYYEITAER